MHACIDCRVSNELLFGRGEQRRSRDVIRWNDDVPFESDDDDDGRLVLRCLPVSVVQLRLEDSSLSASEVIVGGDAGARCWS